MRAALTIVLCLHLTGVTICLQTVSTQLAEDDAAHPAGCPGDGPDSSKPCSEHCGGCPSCPLPSDLPVPAVLLSLLERPQNGLFSLPSAGPALLLAHRLYRPPRAA